MAENKKTKTKKPEKAKKAPKLISAKKLPGILKKRYSEKNFNKKILKKIYIADDKKFLAEFFKSDEKGMLSVPKEQQIPAADFQRLKLIGNEIKKQKGIINFVPFAAVLIFCSVIALTVTIFKNKVVKYGLTTAMENIFEAKTDISNVDLKILSSSLKISGLQQASNDEPMKNLFEIKNITVDFNLTQLLRGKFDAQEISVTELAFGTDRKTDGTLPLKIKKSSKKTASKSNEKSKKTVEAVKKNLAAVFADYNPQAIISNMENNLKSPQLAKKIQDEAESLGSKWKGKPGELKSEVDSLNSQVQALAEKDWKKVLNPEELMKALTEIQDAIENTKKLKSSVESSAKEMSADTKKVKELSVSLNDAIKNDKALIQKELDKFTSFSMDTVKELMSQSLTAAGYSIFGKYYQYVEKGISIAEKFANEPKDSKAKKAKKAASERKRMKGQDIYYKKDTVPALLIEKIAASGTGFSATAKEISNDPDKRGKPAVFDGMLTVAKQKHAFDGIIDGRSNSENPLVTANYSGSNFPVKENLEVLSLNGNAGISMKVSADLDKSFAAKGTVKLSSLALGANAFEPELAYKVYTQALSTISAMQIEFSAEKDSSGDLELKISTDADKQLANAMKNILTTQMASIKADAQSQITRLLNEKTGSASGAIADYMDIEKLMSGQTKAVDLINQKLEAKQKEISAQLKSKMEDAVKSKTQNAADKLLKKLF